MKNRKLLLLVSLVLALTMSLGGTLAYLTDTDSDVNIMTVGNVDITQLENDKADGGFKQNEPLYPAYINGEEIIGAIEKRVNVENTGSSDAYVRTLIAFEAGELSKNDFDQYIVATFDSGVKANWLSEKITVDGEKYFVAYVNYGKVAAGAKAGESLQQVYMSPDATNEIVNQFGDKYQILVLTQAIQTNNFPTEADGWKATFDNKSDTITKANAEAWFNGLEVIPANTVETVAELKDAFAKGGTVILADDIDLGKEMLTINEGEAVYLDLNGHDLKTDLTGKGDVHTALITVNKGASLTINGNGNVHAVANNEDDKVSAIINNLAGNVTINGGNYTMKYDDNWEVCLIPTIVDNNTTLGAATLTINGGTFTHHRNMFRNFSNHKTEVAKIVINGGTFIADGDGAAAIWNQKPSANTPAGAGVVEINGGTFAGVTVDDEFADTNNAPSGDNVTIAPVAKTNEDLNDAIANGETNIYVAAGDFTMPEPELRGKTLTITGTKDTVIDMSAVDARDQFVTGATIEFDGVTLNFGKANYMGLANTASLTYKNCTINGLQFLYGENVTFENCTLNSNDAEHCVWTYGAQNVTFIDCDFTYGDRAVNVYLDNGTGSQNVSFDGCKFSTANTASKGAVEINSSAFPKGVTVNMNGCTAPAYGTMVGISGWDGTNGSTATVKVNDAVIKPSQWEK